jgi:hypothetical protein
MLIVASINMSRVLESRAFGRREAVMIYAFRATIQSAQLLGDRPKA